MVPPAPKNIVTLGVGARDLEPRFLFCGAIKNEYGNWKCPDASACVMAPNPGFHPLQFRRACSSGIVFDDEGGDDETDKEDEEDKSSKPRAFMGDEDRP